MEVDVDAEDHLEERSRERLTRAVVDLELAGDTGKLAEESFEVTVGLGVVRKAEDPERLSTLTLFEGGALTLSESRRKTAGPGRSLGGSRRRRGTRVAQRA